MDVAYDHIQEEVLTPEDAAKGGTGSDGEPRQGHRRTSSLNAEFQEAYKSISSTPWGAKLGGFFSDVKKQGSSFYSNASQEATVASGEALKGFNELRENLARRARNLAAEDEGDGQQKRDQAAGPSEAEDSKREATVNENDGVISRFQLEAAKRLKDLEKAEEAADAAILRFGANIGNFLKEAVSIVPPSEGDASKTGTSQVLFESRDADGKRVIHGTRLEAQLHAIHTSLDKFTEDPEGETYTQWKEGFVVDDKTDDIASDLQKYDELRRTMEKLVPEKVEYKDFWTRYYYLRNIIKVEEEKRREVLKGAAEDANTISWDDDSDDDNSSTPQQREHPPKSPSGSLKTIKAPNESGTTGKEDSARRSQDEKTSQPDSDASYDLVSGATSRAMGSPREKRADDDEEDWE